jgi:hypothetical protein
MKPLMPGQNSAVPDSDPPQNEVLPPGQMLDFPSERDQAKFLKLRAQGLESVFRARLCDACSQECPRTYNFCSETCYLKLNPKEPTP